MGTRSIAVTKLEIAVDYASFLAAVNALESLAVDDREPERYRKWYRRALADFERYYEFL